MPAFEAFTLRQYPPVKQGQAYNSADALLVDAAKATGIPKEHTLVVNDEFGALCVTLRPRALWTDSWLASVSTRQNLARNTLQPVETLWSTGPPINPGSTVVKPLVVMRIPKQLSYLEYQLSQLSQILPTEAIVLAAGMDKHLSPAIADILEAYIGPTERHHGQRKARLFTAVRDGSFSAPFSGNSEYPGDDLGSPLVSLANVFARENVDIGSRFLMQNLNTFAHAENLIDLACGNGIIGLTALSRKLCDKLVLCDESAMAIASAKINTHNNFPGRDVTFHHGDGLLNYVGKPANLILSNPPFHLNHRVDESMGRRLLAQSAGHLVKGGCLALVANRHLNYFPVLKREFSAVEKLAQNSKFIIWLAKR